jgi:O-antigen ligase
MLRVLWILFIFSLPFADMLFFSDVLVGAGQPSTLFAVLLFGVLVLRRPQASVTRLLRDPAGQALAVVIAVCCVSVLMSFAAPIAEWKGDVLWEKSLRQCAQWVLAWMCFGIPLLYIRNEEGLVSAARLYVLTLVPVLIYGVIEFAHYRGVETYVFPALASALHIGTYFGAADQANLAFLPSLQGFPRLRLLASEPSMAGNYLISVLPLVLLFRGGPHKGWWQALGLAGAVALLLTLSAGSFVAALAAVLVATSVFVSFRRAVTLVVVAGSLCLAGYIAFDVVADPEMTANPLAVGSQVLGRITQTGTDISASGRLLEVRTAWKMFTDFPLLGVGIGNWVFHYPGIMSTFESPYVFRTSQVWEGGFSRSLGINNLYLRMLCETGIAGFAVFVLFVARLLKTAAAGARARQRLSEFGFVLTMAAVALLVHFNSMSALDKRYWFFLFGMIAAYGRVLRARPRAMLVRTAPAGRLRSVA